MGVGEGEPYLSRVGSQVISHCVRLLLRHAGEVGGCAGERGVCALGGCGDEMALLCGSFPSVVNRADKIFTSAESWKALQMLLLLILLLILLLLILPLLLLVGLTKTTVVFLTW